MASPSLSSRTLKHILPPLFRNPKSPPRKHMSTSKPFTSTSPSKSIASNGAGTDRGVSIPVIRSLGQLRRWRAGARGRGLEVGVVPTMGALHEGHLDLVRVSLLRHPLTVMTLFVNPMQFAPTEDLASYPRNFKRDLDLLRPLLLPLATPSSSSSSSAPSSAPSLATSPSSTQTSARRSSLRGLGISESDSFRPPRPPTTLRGSGVSENDTRSSSAQTPPEPWERLEKSESRLIVFAPSDEVMYPLRGELQDLDQHRGVTVEMRGYGEIMEGLSRPQFFKGVATICTKLFNAVEPDHAYFGQKDIQQALLLRILVTDMLLAHPLPENLHILPTTRDPQTSLALSSRNAYLTPAELKVAPILFEALSAARDIWAAGSTSERQATGEEMLETARSIISDEQRRLHEAGSDVKLEFDYLEVFDKRTFEPVRGEVVGRGDLVVSGAVWVGKTRLIDNLLLGWEAD